MDSFKISISVRKKFPFIKIRFNKKGRRFLWIWIESKDKYIMV